MLMQADYARRLDVQRGRETNKALRESGKVYGNVPFGCVAVGGEEYVEDGKLRTRGARLFRDPKTWWIRESICNLRNYGSFGTGNFVLLGTPINAKLTPFSQIAAALRERGVTSPEGARHWSKSTLANICETHASLLHLPMMGEKSDAALSTSTETGVSHATH